MASSRAFTLKSKTIPKVHIVKLKGNKCKIYTAAVPRESSAGMQNQRTGVAVAATLSNPEVVGFECGGSFLWRPGYD